VAIQAWRGRVSSEPEELRAFVTSLLKFPEIRCAVGFSFLPASLRPRQPCRVPVSSLSSLEVFQNTEQVFYNKRLSLTDPPDTWS